MRFDDGVHIPQRFRNKIVTHVLKACLDLPAQYRSPLVLAIQGPAGFGKSFQTRHVLDGMNVDYRVLDSSVLAGEMEGDSIKALKRDYRLLGSVSHSLTAIVIDDFDISIASQKSNFERTSNSDILNSFLMHVCDDPSQIDNEKLHAVPIILTGNDFSTLYGPLLRHGRADLFEWIPTETERASIVQRMFAECDIGEAVIEEFIAAYHQRSIAFFQQVRSSLIDKAAGSLEVLARSALFDRTRFADAGRTKVIAAVRNTSREEIFHAAQGIDNAAMSYL